MSDQVRVRVDFADNWRKAGDICTAGIINKTTLLRNREKSGRAGTSEETSQQRVPVATNAPLGEVLGYRRLSTFTYD